MYFDSVCTTLKKVTLIVYGSWTEEWRPENRSRPEPKPAKEKVVFLAEAFASNTNLLALAGSIICQHHRVA